MTSCGTTLGGGLDGGEGEAPRVRSRFGLNDGSLLTLQWIDIAPLNDAITLAHPMLVSNTYLPVRGLERAGPEGKNHDVQVIHNDHACIRSHTPTLVSRYIHPPFVVEPAGVSGTGRDAV